VHQATKAECSFNARKYAWLDLGHGAVDRVGHSFGIPIECWPGAPVMFAKRDWDHENISTANLNLLATSWFNTSAFYRFGSIGNLFHNEKAMIKLKLHCEHRVSELYDKTRLTGLKLVAWVRCVRFVCHLFLLETYHRLVLSQLFLWQRAKMQASAAGGAVEWSNCAVCVLLALLFVASPSRKCLKMSN
jgi:hypothetical protein